MNTSAANWTLTEDQALEQATSFRRSAWKAFLFCLPFLRPHLGRLTLVALADIALVFLNLIPPWFGTILIDRAFPQRDWRVAWLVMATMVATAVVTQLVTAIRTYVYGLVELKIPFELRARMYRHIQKLSVRTLDATPAGEYMFRVVTDSERVAHTIYRIVPTFTMVFEFVLILAFSTYADPVITLIVLLFLVPWTWLFYWVTSISRILDRRRLHCAEIRDSEIQQAASTFTLIKSFGNTRFERYRNGKLAGAAQRVAVHGYLFLVPFELVTQKILPYARQATVFLYLARQVINGQITLGMTVPLTAYLNRLNFPIERIVNFANWVRQTMVSVERMMHILECAPAIRDIPNPIVLKNFSGKVQVQNVSLHRGAQQLHNIDLELLPGKKVAIVGQSGAGKSTLLSVVLRTLLPDSGTVFVDGQNLRDVQLSSYLANVGIVMQETFLFGGSIVDNLQFAKPEATRAEIESALSAVGLLDWANRLPAGLEQDLSSGTMLSIGQKQRIGIARALLVDPKLLLLDEPTSALDAASEEEIVRLLRMLSKNRATLMVSHRIDTVVDADEIIVLKHGEIVERGTHADLYRWGGEYRRLWECYRGSEMDAAGVKSA